MSDLVVKPLSPVMTAESFIANHKQLSDLISAALKQNEDYGVISGTGKPVLLKPGAERLCRAYGLTTTYDIVTQEVDHDRAVSYVKEWRDRGRIMREERTSSGLYRYVVRCRLTARDGSVYGDALASCSSMESKYIGRPRDVENTILKMGCKRALVAATLNAFGLSNRFTQDVGDDEIDVPTTPAATKQPRKPSPSRRSPGFDPNNTDHVTWMATEIARRDMVVDDELGLIKRMTGRPSSDLDAVFEEMGLTKDAPRQAAQESPTESRGESGGDTDIVSGDEEGGQE